jgi:hypothetical protein
MYELEDAREHLEDLVKRMLEAGTIDESIYSVDLGHVFAHLNRAWNTRDQEREYPESERDRFTRYPTDLEPVG